MYCVFQQKLGTFAASEAEPQLFLIFGQIWASLFLYKIVLIKKSVYTPSSFQNFLLRTWSWKMPQTKEHEESEKRFFEYCTWKP